MKKHPLGRSKEESLVLGGFTRLALWFDSRRGETFTGDEVAQIILGMWQEYELSKDTPEIAAFLRQQGLVPDPATLLSEPAETPDHCKRTDISPDLRTGIDDQKSTPHIG